MTYGIYQATAGAVARQNQVDIVAGDLANRDTAGYRSEEVTFETVLREARAPNRQMVMTSEARLDLEPGPLLRTDRAGDFALREPGYVYAKTEGGRDVLLRTASLMRGPDGLLADERGHTVVGDDGLGIRLIEDVPFQLSADGRVHQNDQVIGRLTFQQVTDETALERLGGGAYAVTDASGPAFEQTNTVAPGYLEGSNVQSLEGMVKLIGLERGYQASMKVIQAYREADENLIERTSQ